MSKLVKNIIRFILFILVQVFVLNQIPPLHHLINPYIYFLFILWLPFKIGRRSLMLLALAIGLVLDYFTKTPGLHAAPCVLIAYLRPFLINVLITQEGVEANYEEPSIKSMGFASYFMYVSVLTLIHHAFLFLLEALQFAGVWYFFGKTLLSVAISLFLILIAELLFVRKQKFRTNTA
ncbi:MAG: rod shape-determining protein MreD [Bacteroidota bacterium]|nr:rod shape-determining protein MreD [Bacteroidota bacterium]